MGRLHNTEAKSLAVGVWVEVLLLIWEVATAYLVGGWSKLDHNATLWLHLAS